MWGEGGLDATKKLPVTLEGGCYGSWLESGGLIPQTNHQRSGGPQTKHTPAEELAVRITSIRCKNSRRPRRVTLSRHAFQSSSDLANPTPTASSLRRRHHRWRHHGLQHCLFRESACARC